MWNNIIKSGLKIASPFTSAGVATTTKKPQAAEATSYILRSLLGGRILNLTDPHGKVLGFKVM